VRLFRRAWAADPAIRDFKGLAENAWDFTDPTAMPGFGELRRAPTSRRCWRKFSATVKSRPQPTLPQKKPAAIGSPRHCGANCTAGNLPRRIFSHWRERRIQQARDYDR